MYKIKNSKINCAFNMSRSMSHSTTPEIICKSVEEKCQLRQLGLGPMYPSLYFIFCIVLVVYM